MVFATFLIGLAAGALVVLVAVRPALVERRRRTDQVVGLERDLATATARLEAGDVSLDDRMRDAIRSASAEALQQSNATLVELAGAKLEGTVAPLRESLRKVDLQVQALDRARAQSYGALNQQVESLSERTAALTTALRSPHVRGRWGEIQLKRVVELAGMLPYCDFVEQATTASEDGRLRPDLIVRLPGEKVIVVDAKVPLAAYLEAVAATDDDERARLLADHARQVRDHMAKLSQKAYWQQFADSPEWVVMFLPDEGFFRAAWEQDAELVELAVRSRIHIASPTTLIALLQAIAHGWSQEKVAEDARLVHDLGRTVFERLTVMGGHLARIGTSLDNAVGAYNQTVASLEKRVLPAGRQLKSHITSDKELKELTPVATHTSPLTAPELSAELGLPPLEIVAGHAGDADAA